MLSPFWNRAWFLAMSLLHVNQSDKKLGRKRPSFLEQTQLPVILLTLIHNL